jgi:hypothetical protein
MAEESDITFLLPAVRHLWRADRKNLSCAERYDVKLL